MALVGHNGAGKSSALLAAAGLIPLKGAGRVTLHGEDVHAAARRRPKWLRAQVGVALQFPERSFFHATVREEIGFTSKRLGRSRDEVDMGIRHALLLAGLAEETLERSPFSLSGGEKRRVALACAVAHRPSALLLDEPEAGLDIIGMSSVRSLILAFAAEGGAVLAATHDVAWSLSWANRVIVLRGGRQAIDLEIDEAPHAQIADVLGEHLPDRGAWARLSARLQAGGVSLSLPYRDEGAFLNALKDRLGGGRV